MRWSGNGKTRAERSRRGALHAPPRPAAASRRATGGVIGRVASALVLCAAVSAVTAGCSAPQQDGLRLASTSGDFAIGARNPGAAGFLGSGIEGTSGPASFADGTTVTVSLGPKYFAASGRWCRHYRPVAADGLPAATTSTEIACLAPDGWHRARPVVVTRFTDTSRS